MQAPLERTTVQGQLKRREKASGDRRREVVLELYWHEDFIGEALTVRFDEERKVTFIEFYHADLIGLTALAEGGRVLGTVVAVHDFGAGDLLEISAEDGTELLVPFTATAVPEVDLEGGHLMVHPPEEVLARENGGN